MHQPLIEKSPLVSVWMVTYNHEEFIRQSIESVLMQKTNFPIEIVIGEDASTDGTRKILEELEYKYPGIIKPIYHKNNVGAQRNAYEFCLPKLRGKYIACLEGDDYWTDANKLQKQVEFLELNTEYSGCSHQAEVIYEGTKKPSHPFKANVKDTIELEDLLNGRVFHTASLMFRSDIIKRHLLPTEITSGDRALNFLIASFGKIYFMNDVMCVYRKNEGGISSWVTSSLLKKDLNMIPWICKINKNFPRYKYKSFIYKTAFLYPKELPISEVFFCYSAYVIYSFSFFPENLRDIVVTSIKRLPAIIRSSLR